MGKEEKTCRRLPRRAGSVSSSDIWAMWVLESSGVLKVKDYNNQIWEFILKWNCLRQAVCTDAGRLVMPGYTACFQLYNLWCLLVISVWCLYLQNSYFLIAVLWLCISLCSELLLYSDFPSGLPVKKDAASALHSFQQKSVFQNVHERGEENTQKQIKDYVKWLKGKQALKPCLSYFLPSFLHFSILLSLQVSNSHTSLACKEGGQVEEER